MTLDSNLLTIIAIAVGALGVVATIVAPRLTREARVHAQVFSVDGIRRATQAGDLRIEIHHGSDLIDEPVFIVRGTIQNIGGKDLVSSHFVDPVAICSDVDAEILSVELTPPAGVSVSVEKIDSGWGVRWNMLKPKESIKFLAVVKSSSENPHIRSIKRSIRVEARLRDVKSGPGLLSPDLKFGASLAVVLMLIVIGPISYFGMRPVDAFIYKDSAGLLMTLYPGDGTYKSCRVKTGALYLSDCGRVRPADVSDLLASVKVERIRVGISPSAIIVAALVSGLYGLLFAFSSKDVFGLFRMAMLTSRAEREG